MNWMDLLRMSINNLKRRKLRTFLTVLGVMIGTTSIVVMISLGLGLQQAMLQEIEDAGGMNTINVTGIAQAVKACFIPVILPMKPLKKVE